MKKTRLYLNDLLDYLRLVEGFTADGRDSFMQDAKTQLAVIRAYEVIGEIAKRLPDTLRDDNPQVNWRKLIGFRDFLAHNYRVGRSRRFTQFESCHRGYISLAS